jgi:F-type H+-transporting ATPase subunit delta
VRRHPPALARRYARALHDVAAAEGGNRTQSLRTELSALLALLEGNAELAATLAHPALPAETRGRILRAVVEQAGGSLLLARLVALLANHERVEMLAALVLAYGEELNAAQGVAAAAAVSAVPLDESQRNALTSALGAALGKRIELASQIDPAVLGGLLVRVGGRTYDGSVRARLDALRRRLVAES